MIFAPTNRSRPAMRVLAQIYDRPWLITDTYLDVICGIAERREVDLEAVAARLGRPLENAGGNSYVRDGVAVIGVEGPIVRYADLFSEVSGATSVESLAQDFQQAMEAGNVRQILLNINSPGGQVDGIQELADMIRAGAAEKPVTAYVDGQAASAAYWLAAAASRIVASESSALGSVGVVAAITDRTGAQERQGVKRYEIVSSRAPFKRMDPGTPEGQGVIQEMVDALEDIFIGRLAAFRGVSVDSVQQNFGQGKQFIARKAVGAGMADEINTFEPLVARLAADRAPRAIRQEVTTVMTDPNPTAAPLAAAPTPQPTAPAPPPAAPAPQLTTGTLVVPAANGPLTIATSGGPVRTAETERARIGAILALPEAQGRENLARSLALESDLDAEACRRILATAPTAAPAAPPNRLEAAMATVANPKIGPGGPEADSAHAEAMRVLAHVPTARRIPQRSN
jgi:signal peptide peptidase SppA